MAMYHGEVVVDPDLSAVKNVPPHYWHLNKVTRAILPMSPMERKIRDAHHTVGGVDNVIHHDKSFHPKYNYRIIAGGVFALALSLAVLYHFL